MSGYRLSYLKTTILAAGLGLGAFALTYVAVTGRSGLGKLLIEGTGSAVGLASECVAMSGLVAMYRDRRDRRGKPDLLLARNARRSEMHIGPRNVDLGLRLRHLVRRLVRAQWTLVGDLVAVRSIEEIGATLDKDGCVDALPFMPEMAKFCGQRARVFRCVDKIYDYAGDKSLRQVEDVVLLAGLRCDGGDHGGCQASCYLLWKTVWLRRLPESGAADFPERSRAGDGGGARIGANSVTSAPGPTRYVCQYTQLPAASRPMATWDLRQDLRPLVNGNLTLVAFGVGMLTRLFNAVQGARGGVGYPALLRGHGPEPRAASPGLDPGTMVEVKSKEDIAATLDARGRHRGLWFDREMTKHCGHQYPVLQRIERLIDGGNGRMVDIKTPCVTLAGVDVSGEFLRFCAQHEYPFWREVWLRPGGGAAPHPRHAGRGVRK